MNSIQRILPAALAAALSATTFAAVAQPVDPAVVETAPTERQLAVEADRNVDRRCLEETGSRVTADPQPATPKDQSEEAGHDCAIGSGTVYTRGDIDSTGRTTVKEALQALDPRVF
ncbi:MAG TPA: hypothetical protein VFM73_04950 [Xanthomonadaceae bacterium]|nr:hypothetical protein [Xanthomonadaceae bacterium]